MISDFKIAQNQPLRAFLAKLHVEHGTLRPSLITDFAIKQTTKPAEQRPTAFTISKDIPRELAQKVGRVLARQKEQREQRQRAVRKELLKLNRAMTGCALVRQLINIKTNSNLGLPPSMLQNLGQSTEDVFPRPNTIEQRFKTYPHISNIILPGELERIPRGLTFKRQFYSPGVHDLYQWRQGDHTVVKIKQLRKWLLLFLQPNMTVSKLLEKGQISYRDSLLLYCFLDQVLKLNELMTRKIKVHKCIDHIEEIAVDLITAAQERQGFKELFIPGDELMVSANQIIERQSYQGQ